jgi:hypothetical protein
VRVLHSRVLTLRDAAREGSALQGATPRDYAREGSALQGATLRDYAREGSALQGAYSPGLRSLLRNSLHPG